MMTKFKLLLLILQATFACSASFSQLFSNSDFELGDTNLCGCPTNYTCYNDAGRVTDSVHQDYTTGVLRGCECHDINPILCVNRTTPLKAHSGKSYVYFYKYIKYFYRKFRRFIII